MTATARSLAERAAVRTGSHRGDVDGLRAVAIVLVVAFHARVPGFPGGFIGVDVFFVISGYLITRNLLREASTEGRIGLLGFWGKRIRRLVPAMFLMVIVVFGLAVLVLSALDLSAVAQEGRAAALYVSNIFYAREATDYFGRDINQSLFLHTWSLGVEEQFYLVWPLLFGAACLAARRNAALLRRILVGGFAITLVASLALCVVLTDQGSAWAFFSLPTRAWEFAAAGLLAAWTIPQGLRDHRIQLAFGAVGLTLIGIADLAISATTPYPGLYALLPVVGTVLVIIAGEATSSDHSNLLSTALAVRPAQWLGRVSYSWYLWHWPLILLAVAWLDSDSRRVTVAAALVSLAVATVAHHFFENPIRFNTRLTHSKPKTYTLAATFTAIALLASVGVTKYGDHEIDTTVLAASVPDASGAPVLSLKQLRAMYTDSLIDLCPKTVTSPGGIKYCEGGNPDSATTVVLAGDSHSRQWIPAFVRAAEELDIRVAIRWLGACTSTNVPIQIFKNPLCTGYQRDTDELIDELTPDAVVLANSNSYLPDSGDPADWEPLVRDRLVSIQDKGPAVGVIADTPSFKLDPIDCLKKGGTAESCTEPRERTYDGTRQATYDAEKRAVDDLGDVERLDVNDQLCPDGTCVVWLNGSYVWADFEHMYSGFVVTLTPQVRDFMKTLLGSDG